MGLAAPALAQMAPAPSAPETSSAPAAAPADAAPADAAPADAAPADAAPADAAPADAAPADGAAVTPDAAAAPAPELQPLTEGQAEEAPAPLPEAVPAPAPAPAPVVAAPPPAEPSPMGEDTGENPPSKQCALGKLCMGPVLSLAVINPLGFGAHARYGEHFGFGLDYQFLPTVGVNNVSAGWSLFTVEGRWYPFGGAFFLGGGFAYQSAHMSATINSGLPGTQFAVKGNISMPALKFGLGLMGHDGFVMGIDLALNVPLGSTNVNFQMPTGVAAGPAADMVATAHKNINDTASKGIKALPFIPQLNLIRVGYLF
jgi:hypothetical protein